MVHDCGKAGKGVSNVITCVADPLNSTSMFGVRVVRILHFVNELNDVGNGIVNVAVDLACEQRRDGYDVAIV